MAIDTVVILGMFLIAIVGIRITARTQVAMAVVEYAILIGFAIAGLIAVISHRHGTFPISRSWFSVRGIGGHGSLSAGFLVAMFAYVAWDGTIYVNEEAKHRRTNPGKAAMMAVAFLAVIYTLTQIGLQGVVSPAKLQANSTDALVYTAQALGGSGWAKVMAFGLALSVIATTGTGIVLGARVIYGMANHRVLPPFLGNVNRRFATPVAATVVFGVTLLGLTWAYLLATSLANAFNDLIAVTTLIYAAFYILTALTAITYYWRRVFSNPLDGVILGILPLAAAGFLGWIMRQVAAGCVRGTDLVAGRDPRHRDSLHVACALGASTAVLPPPAADRRPGTLAGAGKRRGDRKLGGSRRLLRVSVLGKDIREI